MTNLDDLFNDSLPDDHRSGVVVVAGRPNVGKSTLINRLIGQKIAIVSPKPQTTRKRQLGIYTSERAQILFIDTPGLHAPQHRLGEYMVKVAETAFRDSDVILLLLDVSEKPEAGDRHLAETVARLRGDTPVVLVLNKTDLLTPAARDANIAAHSALIPQPDASFLISAMQGDGVDDLLNYVIDKLPQGPRYYPTDQTSDMNMRFIAAEVVREKVMLNTEQEIPYSVAVEVEGFQEKDNINAISATIYVERDTQKGIIIGKGGDMIKRIGSQARAELEEMLDGKVFLELHVKVLKNWRSDEGLMKRLGYRMRDED